jgi:hypothetical protein
MFVWSKFTMDLFHIYIYIYICSKQKLFVVTFPGPPGYLVFELEIFNFCTVEKRARFSGFLGENFISVEILLGRHF